jgi:hypothetical protein
MELTPGDRIDLKKKIANALGQQSWGDIDLTLGEFGFPITDQWNGSDRTEYVLDMVRHVSDDASLTQLASYLHPTAVAAAPPQPDSFDDPENPWSGNGLRLFLSHIHDYRAHAGALRRELGKRSIDAFVAHDSINPTEPWVEVILFALRSCDACLTLLTPGFGESKWCDQEVGFCLARDKLVVPVEYGQMPYGFLGRHQALSVKDRDEEAIALSVFELLVRKEQSRGAMARALVDRWIGTTSWDDARENYGFLKMVPAEAWTQQLVNDVWEARDRVNDLRTASINWESSDVALGRLFDGLPFRRPQAPTDP